MDKEYALLKLLIENKGFINSSQIATMLDIKKGTVSGFILSINQKIKGALIISKTGKGNGYYLTILDQDLFKLYLDTTKNESQKNQSINYNNQEERILMLTITLLNNSYIKAEDLIEVFYISRPQLTRDLKRVKKLLLEYNLAIHSRPYKGIKIIGQEIDKRKCMVSLFEQYPLLKKKSETLNIKNIDESICFIQKTIKEQCEEFGYVLSDTTFQNLTVHLLVAFYRVKNNCSISLDETYKTSLMKEKEFPLAVRIVMCLEKCFGLVCLDDEVYYVLAHLSSKRIIDDEYSDTVINQELQSLINQILHQIKIEYEIDFTHDLNLQMMLALHLIPLLNRIKYHIKLKNPLLNEIKANLLDTYDLALCCANVINNHFNCKISEHEISYFAIHLKVALEKNRSIRKKKVLMICSTGKGSAELFRIKILHRFQNQIEHLECCSLIEFEKKDISQYDYIFTTIPIKKKISIPVLEVKYFLDDETEKDIEKMLTNEGGSHHSYFKDELFIENLDAKNKEDCIKLMIKEIKKSYELPEDFYDEILKRETLAETQLSDDVAFPHPAKIMTNDTIICIALLKNPISWSYGKKVKIVILMSFSKGFTMKNEKIMSTLTQLITNKEKINYLLRHRSFQALLEIVS